MNNRILGLILISSLGAQIVYGLDITVTIETDSYTNDLTAFDRNGGQIGYVYGGTQNYGGYWTYTFQITIPDSYAGQKISFGTPAYSYRYSALLPAAATMYLSYEGLPNYEVQRTELTQLPGDLVVDGDIEARGRVFNLGNNPQNLDEPAFSLRIDYDDTYQRNIAATHSATWTWETPGYGPVMSLSSSNGAGYINFGGQISVYGGISVNGSQVLTAAGAGTQFLAPQPLKLAIGAGSIANGANSFASGNGVTASGTYSGAFGLGTTAQGYNQLVVGQYNTLQGTGTANTNANDALFIVGKGASATQRSNAFTVNRNGNASVSGSLTAGSLSIGYGNASGYGSLANGGSTASGSYAVAIGNANEARGTISLAMGYHSQTDGYLSIAAGYESYAQSYASAVFGRYNLLQGGSAMSWVLTDDLFVIGNGMSDTARSNAITVKKNGNTQVFGSFAAGKGTVMTGSSQVVVGAYNDTTTDTATMPNSVRTDGVFIVGAGTATEVKNALRVTTLGKVLVQPAGDIDMGGFTAGEKP